MLESKELRKTEGLLKQMARNVPVNYELKAELLKKFSPGKARFLSWRRITVAISICALLLLFSYWAVTNNLFSISRQPVLAADLKIVNQVSLMDLASGYFGPPVVGKSSLYLPVPDQGTLELPLGETKEDARLITGPDLLFAALSHDGRTAATADSQGIQLYDLKTGSARWLISGDGFQVFYESPSFAPDDKSLLVTKRLERWLTSGHETVSTEIYEVSIDGSTVRKLFNGTCATFTPEGSKIIFEREQKIMVYDVKSGREEVIDEGRFPSVSPDGRFVAYVKNTRTKRRVSDKISIISDLADIWICSLSDYSDKRQVTNNYIKKYISEEDWLKSLPANNIEQCLVYSGTFDYYNPVWGNTSSTLFVLKNSEETKMRVMRIDLAPTPLPLVETVARWLEACINRDDEFARSLMVNPSEVITLSNPHPIAYAITGSGKENGQPYVNVRKVEAYNADSYYSIEDQRFYLKEEKEGFKITSSSEVKRLELVGKEDGIHLIEGNKDQLIFAMPAYLTEIKPPKGRLSSIAISYDGKYLLYAIQKDEGFSVFIHDLEKGCDLGAFQIEGEGTASAAVEDISFDSQSRFAVTKYLTYSNDNQGVAISYKIFLWDLKEQKPVKDPWISQNRNAHWGEGKLVVTGPKGEGNFTEEYRNAWWAGDKLVVEKIVPGGSLRWIYDPETQTRRLQAAQP